MIWNCARVGLIIGALGILGSCTAPPGGGGARGLEARGDGELAVVRWAKLCLVKPDGSGEREVASNVAEDLPIEWSRDGRWIVYTGAAEKGVSDLWGIEIARGSRPGVPVNLTHLSGGVARSPAISADSKYVAFMRDRPAGLYVLTMGSKDPPRRLTHDGQLDQIPTWSADGKSLVYGELVFTDESATEKFRMQMSIVAFDPAASGVAPATPIPAGDGASDSPALSPAVSASGYTLAFRAHRRGNDDIGLLDPAQRTSPEINLTNSAADEHDPVWSPDGTRLAFWRRMKLAYELWTIKPDGTGATQVCALVAKPAPGAVEWSPDGRELAFATSPKGGVWVVQATGGEPRRVGEGTQVRWR